MFLRRSDAGAVPLILSQGTGEPLVTGDNLEFNHQAVPRFTLIRDLQNCCGWEIGYFGTDAWNTATTNDPGISPVVLAPGLPIGSTAPGTVFRVDYGTDLDNAEFNLRRRTDECITWIAGFRFVELQDFLRVSQIAPVNSQIYSIGTQNQLYGFQLGSNVQLLRCNQPFHIDGIWRAGIYGNHVQQTTSSPLANQIPNAAPTLNASGSQTSFVGELGVRGVYQVGPSFAVYGGYQALWLDGIALAPNQLPITNLFNNPSAALDSTNSLFFHGATVGFMASF
jgi:hypothetical protein